MKTFEQFSDTDEYLDLEVYWSDTEHDYIGRVSLDKTNGEIFRTFTWGDKPHGEFLECESPVIPADAERALKAAETHCRRESPDG